MEGNYPGLNIASESAVLTAGVNAQARGFFQTVPK
jgi:hypothetical protein